MAQAKPADRLFGSDSPDAMGEPYSPHHLTRAVNIADNGTVDLSLCIYFPGESSGEGDRTLQVKVGSRPWQAIAPGDDGYWSLEVNRLVPGTPRAFATATAMANGTPLLPSPTWSGCTK
ncbi:MAG: hypothetical protein HC925_05900 [Coleofasciculaceae cyanobacterium SM2_3_26]|nr:hypothetical protein [Coleofasciculaceae cyanobacterium SM2_3_26]